MSSGDGPLRTDLETLAQQLGIPDAVHFLGHVQYDAMPAVYRSAKALLLPSRVEGMPRAVLEAMATGLPVVASDIDQIEALVQQAGRTAPVGNSDAYAKRLEDVLQHESAAASTGRQTIIEDYQWDGTVVRTTDRLRSLL